MANDLPILKIAIGSEAEVRKRGHEVTLVGLLRDEDVYWPAVAQQVAEAVVRGDVDEGVLFCRTGTWGAIERQYAK